MILNTFKCKKILKITYTKHYKEWCNIPVESCIVVHVHVLSAKIVWGLTQFRLPTYHHHQHHGWNQIEEFIGVFYVEIPQWHIPGNDFRRGILQLCRFELVDDWSCGLWNFWNSVLGNYVFYIVMYWIEVYIVMFPGKTLLLSIYFLFMN